MPLRARKIIAACVVLFAGAVVACSSDLFHSTDDLKSACDVDPRTPGCGVCMTDSVAAAAAAERACDLLGTCERPSGGSRFGDCMLDALSAFDCGASANRQVRGPAQDFWGCMAKATTCDAVHQCVHPGASITCKTGTYTNCQGSFRVLCTTENGGDAGLLEGTGSEPCAARGQTCSAAPDGKTRCVADVNGASCNVAPPACATGGTVLHDCATAGVDRGLDCASFGAGKCVTNGSVSACLAERGPACTASYDVRCEGDVAVGCPSGVEERVDCAKLTGPGTCKKGAPVPAWSVAAACVGGDTCGEDRCDGTTLVSCARGKTFRHACAVRCAVTVTADGNRALCVPTF